MVARSEYNFRLLHSFSCADAPHIRTVFYRMGLTDKDIVALSGGHTLVRFPLFLIGWYSFVQLGLLLWGHFTQCWRN